MNVMAGIDSLLFLHSSWGWHFHNFYLLFVGWRISDGWKRRMFLETGSWGATEQQGTAQHNTHTETESKSKLAVADLAGFEDRWMAW